MSGVVELEVAKYCVVLLDLMMPNFDGISVIRYLNTYHREVLRRVVVVTATTAEPLMEEIRKTEVFAIIAKPFDPAEVADVVRRCAALPAALPADPLRPVL